jgi:hypothetical protein
MVPQDLIHQAAKIVPNGRHDWLMVIRTSWPMIVALVLVTFWLGGRMESPEQKSARIQLMLQPLEVRIAAIEGRMNGILEVEAEETDLIRALLEARKRETLIFSEAFDNQRDAFHLLERWIDFQMERSEQ